jgi:hypothetical protein
MNYKKIYDNLIFRGKNRILNEGTESHHIIPRCLGGDDSLENLVDLTYEEHYVAHQLLVKLYPNNPKIIMAAVMMRPNRPSNKLYGWLKRRFAEVQSKAQSGKGNSQYGTRWVFNEVTQESKKISKEEKLPHGWKEGRRVSNWTKVCCECGKEFTFADNKKYCSDACKKQANPSPFIGKEKLFLDYYAELGSMNKALKKMGYPGAISHYYNWAKKVLDKNKE